MVEKTESSARSELVDHSYKPLIYILPKDSSNLKQLVSTEIQAAGKDSNKGYLDIAIERALAASKVIENIGLNSMYSMSSNLLVWGLKRLKESQNSTGENSEASQEIKNELSSHLDRINLDIADWIEFIEQIPFARIPQEIDFPPGHPLPRRLYRVHPLKKKRNRYIPVEVFDFLLYEEREAELVKLLIDLGAVEITINNLSSTKTKGGVIAKATASGIGGFETKNEGEREILNSDTRLIKLGQKNWNSEKFDEAEYSWLAYEPSWEVLVHARLRGQCLSSSVELNSDASYSISASLGLTEGLIQQFADVGGGIEFSNLYKESKLFEIKFIDDSNSLAQDQTLPPPLS